VAFVASLVLLGAASPVLHAQQAPAAAPSRTGRVAGRVVDRETGRPIGGARIQVSGAPGVVETDLEGKYRTPALPIGLVSVRATMIGFKPVARDSIRIPEGQAAIVDFTLVSTPIELEEMSVQAEATPMAGNDAGLLSMQQAAAGVSDGISSQAIARSPDNNAGEAVKRITGVTLFDGKFLVVRGLGERYSNALLNGAEMPSAVVEKKVPPLDLFPAGLLDNVVASKTATPDKPGDFAGGSVELTTKDFPEKRLLQIGVSQSFRQGVTFQDVPLSPLSGSSLFGFDNGKHEGPANIPYGGSNYDKEIGYRVLQGFRNNVWVPAPRRVGPGTGANFSYGDQFQSATGGSAFGFVLALTYNNKANYTPNRVFNIYNLGFQSSWNVDWGGVANFAFKPSPSHKFSFRNLYTRSAEEKFLEATGAPPGLDRFLIRSTSAQYLERYLWQSQLAGEHGIVGTAVSWKATYGRARINDPDNHGARYQTNLDVGGGTTLTGKRLIRRLADETYSGQLDISLPFTWHHRDDALLKVGGYLRRKHRDYFARDVGIVRKSGGSPTPLDSLVTKLPPELAFAPENLGTVFDWLPSAEPNDPFFANDKIYSAYAMGDFPIFPWLRLVGGARAERWMLDVFPGGDNPLGDTRLGKPPISRRNLDILPSANLTLTLAEQVQLRFAGSRTVARPDSREISPGRYSPIGGIGTCAEAGDTTLQRTRVTNWDGRLEIYPRPGELFAISGFTKRFEKPIIEIRASAQSGEATCPVTNAERASVDGVEFELRKGLDFLSHSFRNLGFGVNVAVVDSKIDLLAGKTVFTRKFVGQSPFVLNAFLAFEPVGGPFQLSVLYNYYDDRTRYYAFAAPTRPGDDPSAGASWIEKGRSTLDAKLKLKLFSGLRMTAAGQNLTRTPVEVREDRGPKRLVDGYNPGISGSLGFTYDF
jgi:outer membrane receptor protein involved in Fe transport